MQTTAVVVSGVVATSMAVLDIMVHAFGGSNNDLDFSVVVWRSEGCGGGNCGSSVEMGYRGNYESSGSSSRGGIKWQWLQHGGACKGSGANSSDGGNSNGCGSINGWSAVA